MFTYIVIFYLLVHVAAAENDKKSFTVVLDTTLSMREEIDIFKTNIETVVGNHLTDVDNYILLPFNDPGFGPAIIRSKPEQLVDVASIVEVGGGRNCPENSVPAIQEALKLSKPNSFIFVFTDGYAVDYRELNSIKNLCSNSKSQVIIFLSGKCVPVNAREVVGTIDPYFDIAQSCSGTVLQFDLTTFRKAFKVMNELMNTEWSDIKVYKIYIGPMQYSFTVDKYTKDITLAVSGEHPTVEIIDINGRWPAIEYIVNTQQSKVLKIIKPPIGHYTVNILCQGPTIATIYKKRQLEFRYGFSPKMPRSLKETSNLPIPGITSFVYFEIAEVSVELNSVLIKVEGVGVKKVDVVIVDRSNGLYAARDYFAPEKSFTIIIYGRDDQYQIIKGTTGTIRPQEVQVPQVKKPRIEMIDPAVALVNFNSNVSIACKVSGYPKPTITWNDDVGTEIISEYTLLEMPSVYISYAFIEKVTKNSTVYCKCESEEGMDSMPMELYVNRTFTFDVIKYPEDATFEYGTEGKLFCEIDAYPEATIKWYHNDSLVGYSNRLEIVPEENMILIKNMTTDDTGDYKCVISNSVESKTYVAIVDISGMEQPEIELKESVLIYKLDEWVNIECILKRGKPKPRIHWTFETKNGFGDIPDGVSAEDNFLKFPSIKTEHRGVYRCEAANIFGSATKELQIEVQYAPKIRFNEKEVTVKRNEYVQLSCEVDAIPKAQVKWEMSRDQVIVPLVDSRFKTDEWNTLSFTALSSDTGSYKCTAENFLGTAEITTTLNVLVAPYIEPPPSKMLIIKPCDTITLPCHVLYGHPDPKTKWEFIASNGAVTTVMSGGTINNLIIRKALKQHEGSYICLAENDAGSDTIKIIVKVM